MQKDRLIPERQIERNKPHQNTTGQFDAVYLNVFGKKKKAAFALFCQFCFLLGFGVHLCWKADISLRRLRQVRRAEGSRVTDRQAKRDESRRKKNK